MYVLERRVPRGAGKGRRYHWRQVRRMRPACSAGAGTDWARALRKNGGSEKSLLPAPQVAAPHEAWPMGICIINIQDQEVIMKILDFDLEGNHFIMEAEVLKRQQADDDDDDRACRWLRYLFENTQVYKETDGVVSPFRITGVAWAGYQLTADHALRDVLGRISRNETGKADRALHLLRAPGVPGYVQKISGDPW